MYPRRNIPERAGHSSDLLDMGGYMVKKGCRSALELVFCAYLMAAGCGKDYTSEMVSVNILLANARNSRVISFGETHNSEINPEFVGAMLPLLRDEGFNYFAAEIPNSNQGDLDAYLEGRISKEELYRRFNIRKDDDGPDSTMSLLADAKRMGFKIIAFDSKMGDYVKKYGRTPKWEAYLKRFGDDPPEKVDPFMDYCYYMVSDEREGEAMNNIREKIFDVDPEAKVVVMAGAMHINEGDGCTLERRHAIVRMLGSRLSEFTGGSHFSVQLSDTMDDGLPEHKVDWKLGELPQKNMVDYLRHARKKQHRQNKKQSRGKR